MRLKSTCTRQVAQWRRSGEVCHGEWYVCIQKGTRGEEEGKEKEEEEKQDDKKMNGPTFLLADD